MRFFPAVIIMTLISTSLSADEPWTHSATIKTLYGDIHYRVAGDGEPLLLLHGFTGYGGQWASFLPELTDQYTVIAPDLPGHGGSTTLAQDFSVSDAAESMWVLVDQLGYDRIRAIGYSAGGMTLLQMALVRPSGVQAMILAASAFDVAEEPVRAPFEDLPSGYQQDLLRNHSGDRSKIKALLQAGYVNDIQLGDLRSLNTPTLLIAGDRDESFPLRFITQTYEALPNARLWIIPDLGHALFWPWGGSQRLADAFPAEARRFFETNH